MFIVSESGNPDNSFAKKPLAAVDPFLVDFYRSKEQSQSKYGSQDTTYNGEFGFDRFNSSIMAEGLRSNFIEDTTITRKRGTDKSYLCPYLSLWPPAVTGNLNNAKSSATIYVALEKADKHRNDGSTALVTFESTDSNLTIDTLTTKKINMQVGGASKLATIKVDCMGEIKAQAEIVAKLGSSIIGRLIVLPNHERYKMKVKPVVVHLGAATSTSITNTPIASSTYIDLIKVAQEANTKAFNQALVQCEMSSNVEEITVDQNDFTGLFFRRSGKNYLQEAFRFKFNSIAIEQYGKILKGTASVAEENAKEDAYQQSGMHQAIIDFCNAFTAKVNYPTASDTRLGFEKGYDAHQNKLYNTAWNDPSINNGSTGFYDQFEKAEQRMKQLLTQKGVTNPNSSSQTHLPSDGFVYLFMYPDVEASLLAGSTSTTSTVPGYTADRCTHMFASGFSKHKEIIHELGHALALEHPFEQSLGKYIDPNMRTQERVKEDITQIKARIDFLNKEVAEYAVIKNMLTTNGITMVECLKYQSLHDLYTSSKSNLLNNKNNYNNYLTFLNDIQGVQDIMSYEQYFSITPLRYVSSTLAERTAMHQQQIAEKTQKQAELFQLNNELQIAPAIVDPPNYHPQSETIENYMDYDFAIISGAIVKKSSFERKSLYQSQWQKMKDWSLSQNPPYLHPL